jgi:hypothetical protein
MQRKRMTMGRERSGSDDIFWLMGLDDDSAVERMKTKNRRLMTHRAQL